MRIVPPRAFSDAPADCETWVMMLAGPPAEAMT